MGNMKVGNYIISAVMLILGIVMTVMASEFKIEFGSGDPGAGFWPVMLGILLIVLSAILLVSTIKNGESLKKITFTISNPANKRVYLMMAFIAVFCVILYFLGFYIAAALFIPVTMYVLEVRKPLRIFITTAATVAGIYVIFGMLLKISLPAPFFMR